MKYKIPYLDETVDTSNLKEYYFSSFDYKDSKISVILIFNEKTIDVSELDKIEPFLKDLEKQDKKNLSKFKKDVEIINSTVYDYIEHYIDCREIKNCTPKDLLDKLYLKGIFIEPIPISNSKEYATFDYRINSDFNSILVVSVDKEGTIIELTVDT